MSEYKMPFDKLIPALVAFQSAVKAPPKTKENPHLKNKYADLQDVIDTIREPLSANGLAISHEVSGMVLTTKLLHVSGQFLTTEMPLLMGKQDMQGLGSALTYARRYSVSALLGIASDDCDDGNGAANRATPANTNNPAHANSAPKNPCSEAQQRRIETLWQELGRTEAALKKELQKTFKVESVSLLSVPDAVTVIKALNELVVKKNEAQKQTDGATAGATESTPA